jgi:hypothetical protein
MPKPESTTFHTTRPPMISAAKNVSSSVVRQPDLRRGAFDVKAFGSDMGQLDNAATMPQPPQAAKHESA